MTDSEFKQYQKKQRLAEYNTYVQSPWWEDKRQQAFKFYGRKCNRCGSTKNLHVHHKTYANLFDEKMEDLEIACQTCHRAIHSKKAPKKPARRTPPQRIKGGTKAARPRKQPKEPRSFGAEVQAIIRAENRIKEISTELDEGWVRAMRLDR